MKRVISIVALFIVIVISGSLTLFAVASGDTKDHIIMPPPANALLYDDNGIRILAGDFSRKDDKISLSLHIENGRDKEVLVSSGVALVDYLAVNSFMLLLHSPLEVQIPSHTSREAEIMFFIPELEVYGINSLSELVMAFSIEEDGHYLVLDTGPLKVETGASHNTEEEYLRPDLGRGKVYELLKMEMEGPRREIIYQDETITAGSLIYAHNDNDKVLFLDVQNLTDEEHEVLLSDIFVNGIRMESRGHKMDTVLPGKHQLSYIALSEIFSKETLATGVFDRLEKVDFIFEIDKYEENYYATERISVNFAD